MWIGMRQVLLERHDFYVEQVKAKVLSQFRDIESEAERYGNAEYDRLGELPGDEDSDMAEIAEEAMGRAQNFYGLLSDLKKQMILAALGGMYHQWEKDLREFIERELRHNYTPETVAKVAWGANIADVFKVLSDFGWNYSACHFFSRIDACRLIVNVYKHGKGQSLEELARRYPEYLNVPLAFEGERRADFLNHEWLSVSEAQFDDIAAALRSFWEVFPERLFLAKQDK
jgi:hypothetical protein